MAEEIVKLRLRVASLPAFSQELYVSLPVYPCCRLRVNAHERVPPGRVHLLHMCAFVYQAEINIRRAVHAHAYACEIRYSEAARACNVHECIAASAVAAPLRACEDDRDWQAWQHERKRCSCVCHCISPVRDH